MFRKNKPLLGYGLAFLMVFLATTILTAFSLRLMSNLVLPTSLNAYSDNFTATTVTTIAFDTVRQDILSKLNAGTTVDTSYRYPASGVTNVTTPKDPNTLTGQDPTNATGLTDVVGTYYATLLYARGNSYLVKITATSGGSTVTQTQLIQLKAVTAPFSCNGVTTSIQGGNISTVSSAYLVSYATNNCMLITAVPPAAPTTSDGATACGSQSGAGTLQLTSSLNCAEAITGTYGTVYLHSGTSLSGGSFASTSSNARTINIPGTIASNKTLTFSGSGAQTVLFADAGTLTKDAIDASASSGNNIFRLNGIYKANAANLTWNTGTGNSQVYLQQLFITGGGGGFATYTETLSATSGSNQFYIDTMLTDQNDGGSDTMKVMVTGGSGNDTISCNGTLGTSPACTIQAHQGQGSGGGIITIDGGAGNNIISLNTMLTSNLDGGVGNATVTVYGGTNTSYNIIYAQGCTTTTGGGMGSPTVNIYPGNVGGSSGGNLVIVNNLLHCTFTGQTNNDVLLYHTGTPTAGFGRTLTY